MLFTGDAGIPALSNAAGFLEQLGIVPNNLSFIQVPHHGSRRNVGPAVLNRILGPKLAQEEKLRTAFVSASKDGLPKHPAKKVTNAFRRRGSPVYGATGRIIWHHSDDAPARAGWVNLTPIPLYNEVDK